KSTLLSAIYRYCANLFPDRKITTAEDPVEYIIGRKGDVLPATQLELGRDVATFAEAIRAALRRAPSIIGVGEMRDTETILAAVLSALLGHLCLSTLHTDSVGETIPRLLAGIPIEIREATARDVMGTMQYIIVQRLLRTTDGKRQAVREYLVFDQPLRN
ncbi:ATPase, T2SS/T4P/T4SS family, partial [Klebsiella pneumoniae]|nr:ATPase, T2SS/T4P/T4SS family [Klebsiella pneumoniae]